MSRDLRAVASVTGSDVTADEGVDAGPRMVAEDVFDGRGASGVTPDNRVVVLMEDICAKGRRHVDGAVVEDEVVVGREVGVAADESFTPRGIFTKGAFKALEEFGVVDGEGSDGRNAN